MGSGFVRPTIVIGMILNQLGIRAYKEGANAIGTTDPGADPRGLRTYFRNVQSTGTVPDVRALE